MNGMVGLYGSCKVGRVDSAFALDGAVLVILPPRANLHRACFL